MGVLYARVGGAWEAVSGSTIGEGLPLTGGTLTGTVAVGGHPFSADTAGIEMFTEGSIETKVEATSAASYPNLRCNRQGAGPGGVGGRFITFAVNSSNGGMIQVASATTVNYNTGSDYRLKDNIGPVANVLDRLSALNPVHFTWKADGVEQDGFLAHEVAEVVPIAVNGEKDAVDDDGEIEPQQMDNSKLVPLLTAALQEAVARIEALEDRLEAVGG